MASQQIIEEKAKVVESIKEKIKAAQGIVLVDYIGLTVEQDTAMRSELRKNGIEYSVLKNRLVQRAFNELGYNEFDSYLNGPTAIAFSNSDCVVPCKLMSESADKYAKMKIKCGMADGKFIDETVVNQYAKLPSREQLLINCVFALSGLVRGLAVCLNKIAEKEENN
ncbi:MAG: 50S ribosomal protein L10 [Eubacteriales bacterium]|nr:50S ribosomal protein L10 [Eubacteriales bacterium]